MRVLYKIGAFAKNLGVSAGFLKHHESYGLLQPVCTKSGYRYYEIRQGTQVIQCLKLQSLGFSSKEAADLLLNLSGDALAEKLDEKQLALRKKIQLYQLADEYLTGMRTGFSNGGVSWEITQNRSFYCCENAHNNAFEETKERQQVAQAWNEYMPLVEIFTRYPLQREKEIGPEILGKPYMGIRIDAEAGETLQIYKNDAVKKIESRKCLIYHTSGHRNVRSDKKRCAPILEAALCLCATHGFVPADDIFTFQQFGSTVHVEDYVLETALIPLEPWTTKP